LPPYYLGLTYIAAGNRSEAQRMLQVLRDMNSKYAERLQERLR
jgi:hypothetical protein